MPYRNIGLHVPKRKMGYRNDRIKDRLLSLSFKPKVLSIFKPKEQ